MNGFFQVRRKFFSHPLWLEERVFSRAEAFLDLLQLAAFVRTRRIVSNAMIPLERGEVCASERYLATRWKWSTSKVRAYLTLLEADKMIAKQKKQGVTVIRLCNYERYNPESAGKKAEINQGESGDEAASKQIEEGKEGEVTLPPQKRRGNPPTIEECEDVACKHLPANKVFAASVARQFHSVFLINDWFTSTGIDLCYKGKWKTRLHQMLEEEGRKGMSRSPKPNGSPPPRQRPGSGYDEYLTID